MSDLQPATNNNASLATTPPPQQLFALMPLLLFLLRAPSQYFPLPEMILTPHLSTILMSTIFSVEILPRPMEW